MRLGGLNFAPTIAFNSGIDTNVFNVADQPKSDFTWTLSPKAETSMNLGRARLSSKSTADFVYFQRAASERSVNLDNSIKLAVPLNRFEPYVAASFLRTRQRPNYEIDARSLRHERSVSLGGTARLSGKTKIDLSATRSAVDFDASAVFLDTYLREVLNRTTTLVGASLRHQLTPLTTLNLAVDASNEQFQFTPLRDSRSIRVAPGFEFDTSALISGRASVGHRALEFRDPSVPDFKGTIASVDVAYTPFGTTRLLFQVSRDIEYSYEVAEPYYLQSTVGGGVIRQISDSVGITVRGARSRLNFRGLAPEIVSGGGRIDRFVYYGAGVIHKLGRNLRFNVTADYYKRSSPQALRDYGGLRAGSSILYGF